MGRNRKPGPQRGLLAPAHGPQVVRVTQISGEEHSVPAAEIYDVKSLKQKLQPKLNVSPFRQDVCHGNKVLCGDAKVHSEMDLTVVTRPSVEASGSQRQRLANAAQFNKVTEIQAQLQLGIHPDFAVDGTTPLILASCKGHVAAVWLFLQGDANPDFRDGEGRTALMNAARFGHVQVARLLLRAGARVDLRDDDKNTAMDLATNDTIRAMLCEAKILTKLAAKDVEVEPGAA
ncbi:ANKRD50 [Symbiodinium sp. CCMP2592]|nr:ANKRD50 [Symbiodinium sp. CCMP2592]